MFRASMTNETPGVIVPAESDPMAAEPFIEERVRKILVVAATEVLATTLEPAMRVACPILAFAPSLTLNPFPAVPILMFPLVAVIAPNVAVIAPAVTVRAPEDTVTPPAPFGVKTRSIAAFVPVPDHVFPLRVVAVATVAVTKLVAVAVTTVGVREPPRDSQVAIPPTFDANMDTVPWSLSTQICPRGYPVSDVDVALLAINGSGN